MNRAPTGPCLDIKIPPVPESEGPSPPSSSINNSTHYKFLGVGEKPALQNHGGPVLMSAVSHRPDLPGGEPAGCASGSLTPSERNRPGGSVKVQEGACLTRAGFHPQATLRKSSSGAIKGISQLTYGAINLAGRAAGSPRPPRTAAVTSRQGQPSCRCLPSLLSLPIRAFHQGHH